MNPFGSPAPRSHRALEHAQALREGLCDIGQAAQASGVSVKMIRHYESLGLLGAVARTQANYRVYSPQHIHTLGFIKRARSLGFSMSEIETLLSLWQDKKRSSAQVKKIASRHLEDLQTRIAQMQAMASTLEQLLDCCHGNQRPDCPILDDLESSSSQPA